MKEFEEFEGLNIPEHFIALTTVMPYVWISTRGELRDIRKMPHRYLTNLLRWMREQDNKRTPYMDTPQFKNAERAEKRCEARFNSALNALRRSAR